MAYRTQLLLFSPPKKVTKKSRQNLAVSGVPLSLKEDLKRLTVNGFEYMGNVDALRAAYSLHGHPGRDSTVRYK